jgi:hypothetical protein
MASMLISHWLEYTDWGRYDVERVQERTPQSLAIRQRDVEIELAIVESADGD